MTTIHPMNLFRAAVDSAEAQTGYYNKNVAVETSSGQVVVRIPIEGADEMDLRVWPEHEVLRAVEPYVEHAPKVLHVSQSPPFSVYEFVGGDLVDRVAPRGVPVPGFVLRDVVDLFAELVQVPRESLPSTPLGWPDDADTAAFGHVLSTVTEGVYARFRQSFASLFSRLGVPAEPVETVREAWPTLASRPFRLVHADVHRKNMIANADRAVFLDWELALWGDPLYDLAVHLHKMSYHTDERDTVVRGWLRALPGVCTRQWRHDLDVYLRHERVKSAIVDTIRYTKQIAAGMDDRDPPRHELLDKLTDKLNVAGEVWGWSNPLDRPSVQDAVRGWVRGG